MKEGHDLAERFEEDLRNRFDQATVFTHLEPIEDPISFVDTGLDRTDNPHEGPTALHGRVRSIHP